MAYSRTLNHFTSMQELATIWASSTSYLVNQPVIHNNFLYRCAVAHTSAGSFQTDLAAGRWERVSSAENAINWASGVYYVLNQLVIDNDKLYKCLVAHTSGGTFIADLQAAYWVEISASAVSGINYVTNPNAEVDTSGWATYAESDAVTFQDTGDTVTLNSHGLSNGTAISFTSITSTTGISINTRYYVVNATTNTFQVATSVGGSALALTTNGSGTLVRSIPKLGTGGSPAVTFTRNISSPLRGDADFRAAKDAANRMGQGVSYDFTIDDADLAKVLTLSFDYELVTATGTYANADLVIYLIQDPTGTPVVIQPAGYTILSAASMLPQRQITTFQTSSSVKSYRLCVHVASVSATAYTLAIDNVSVGPQVIQYGAPVTDWVSYTPTGTWTSNTTYAGKYRRVGDSLQVQITVKTTGAPNATALAVNMPSGIVIDDSKLEYIGGANSTASVGSGNVFQSSASTGYACEITSQSTSNRLLIRSTTTASNANVTNTVPFTFANGDSVTFFAQVPILGWSSTVQMSNDTDTRVVAFRGYRTTNLAVTANTTKVSLTTDVDTHAAWNTDTYTVPVAGLYRVTARTLSSASTGNLRIYKNGVAQASATNFYSGQLLSGQYLLQVNAGETIDFRSDVTLTLVSSSTYQETAVTIERLSGPSAIAASETVAARYSSIAGLSVASGTIYFLDFPTKSIDTHGAVSGAGGGSTTTVGTGWKFTAPISGIYLISPSVTFSTQVVQDCTVRIYKNNSVASYNSSPSISWSGDLAHSRGSSDLIQLNAGDVIQIGVSQTAGSSRNLSTIADSVRVSINRIGG